MDESNYVLTKKGSEELRRAAYIPWNGKYEKGGMAGDTIISDYGKIRGKEMLKCLVLQAVAYGPMTFEEIVSKIDEIYGYENTGLKFWGKYPDEKIKSTIKRLQRRKLIRDISDLALWRGTPGYNYPYDGEDSPERHNVTSEGWIYREM